MSHFIYSPYIFYHFCHIIDTKLCVLNMAAATPSKPYSNLAASSPSVQSPPSKNKSYSTLFHDKDDDAHYQGFTFVSVIRKPKLEENATLLQKLDYLVPIFTPLGVFKTAWNAMLFCVLVISVIDIPYNVAFAVEIDVSSFSGRFSLLSDILLMLDIILSLRTSYVERDDGLKLQKNAKCIARRYLRCWFAFDIVMSAPFEFMMNGQYVQCLQLLRLVRIQRFLNGTEMRIKSTVNSHSRLLMAVFKVCTSSQRFSSTRLWHI